MFVDVNGLKSIEKRWDPAAVFAALSLMLCLSERAVGDQMLWLSREKIHGVFHGTDLLLIFVSQPQ